MTPVRLLPLACALALAACSPAGEGLRDRTQHMP